MKFFTQYDHSTDRIGYSIGVVMAVFLAFTAESTAGTIAWAAAAFLMYSLIPPKADKK